MKTGYGQRHISQSQNMLQFYFCRRWFLCLGRGNFKSTGSFLRGEGGGKNFPRGKFSWGESVLGGTFQLPYRLLGPVLVKDMDRKR